MDPNEALKRIRAAIAEYESLHPNTDDEADRVDTIIDHFCALDGWLERGGFPPTAWSASQFTTTYDLKTVAGVLHAIADGYQVEWLRDGRVVGRRYLADGMICNSPGGTPINIIPDVANDEGVEPILRRNG